MAPGGMPAAGNDGETETLVVVGSFSEIIDHDNEMINSLNHYGLELENL